MQHLNAPPPAKLCPNCAHNVLSLIPDQAASRWRQTCCACFMCGPYATSQELANDAWNSLPRRAEIERLEQRIESMEARDDE